MPASTAQADSALPVPQAQVAFAARRLRRLKRFGIATAVTVVLLVVLRVLWGVEAWRRLNAQIAQYRAAGQMVTVEEFDAELDKVPESRNAAVLYEKAMGGLVAITKDGVVLDDLLYDKQRLESNMPAARELMESNAEVLKLLRRARDLPEVAWSMRLSSAAPPTGILSGQRMAAKFLYLATGYYFQTDDHAAAVATLQDFLAFDDAIASHPDLISSLVAWTCHGLAFKLIEDHGSKLQVSGSGSNLADGVIAASREEVRQLLARLLSEESIRRDAVRSYYGSRARTLHTLNTTELLDSVQPGSLGVLGAFPLRQAVNTVFRPVLVQETSRLVSGYTLLAEAALEESWPAAAGHFPPSPSERVHAGLLYRVAHPITCNVLDCGGVSHTASVRQFFQVFARRRMAAIALAIRLYAVDHGQRPTELAALVPQYLERLPQDPFAVGKTSFGYKPFPERPFLYSVGPDGKDNDGQDVHTPDGRRDPDKSDICFHLEPDLTAEPRRSPEPAPVVPPAPSPPEASEGDKY